MFSIKFRGVLLFLALFSVAAPASGDEFATSKLRKGGFDPSLLDQKGQAICQGSPSDRALAETANFTSNITAYMKRARLVSLAVGFAAAYNQKRNYAKILSEHGNSSACDSHVADCTKTDELIREVAKIPPGVDWCAAFISLLANSVDEQFKDSGSNLLTSKSGSAFNYASALKLLSLFDPHGKHPKVAWGETAPVPRKHAFLSPNVRPVPGCMAIFQDKNGISGHMALVTSVSGIDSQGTMSTIEGNTTPTPNSHDRGIFAKEDRPWGANAVLWNEADKTEMVYRGCVLPWSNDSALFNREVCSQGASDNRLKTIEDTTDENRYGESLSSVISTVSGSAAGENSLTR